jgi:hypothetical protein
MGDPICIKYNHVTTALSSSKLQLHDVIIAKAATPSQRHRWDCCTCTTVIIAAKRYDVSERLLHLHVIIAETAARARRQNRCKALWRQNRWKALRRQLDIRPLLSYTYHPLATPLLTGWPADLICIKSALSWAPRLDGLYYSHQKGEHTFSTFPKQLWQYRDGLAFSSISLICTGLRLAILWNPQLNRENRRFWIEKIGDFFSKTSTLNNWNSYFLFNDRSIN